MSELYIKHYKGLFKKFDQADKEHPALVKQVEQELAKHEKRTDLSPVKMRFFRANITRELDELERQQETRNRERETHERLFRKGLERQKASGAS